jgi:chromosome segregation ATPase
MFIGPTLTLEQLNKFLNKRLQDEEHHIGEVSRQINDLRNEMKHTQKTILDNNRTEVNPNYISLQEKFNAKLKLLDESNDTIEFLNDRIDQLESIEKDPLHSKEMKYKKITLSSNDCLMLGVPQDFNFEKETIS